jgi:hypothetical protein
MLGFKISYPPDWNLTDNDFVISFRTPQIHNHDKVKTKYFLHKLCHLWLYQL